jgi:hypothetical protein
MALGQTSLPSLQDDWNESDSTYHNLQSVNMSIRERESKYVPKTHVNDEHMKKV